MVWASALALGLISGFSRSGLVIAVGAALVMPVSIAEIIAAQADLFFAPLVVLAAIGAFNLGIVAGAITGMVASR